MKLTIGPGTPIECDYIFVDGPVVKVFADVTEDGKKKKRPMVFAYHLHPGEAVRRTADGNYEVNL